ncbi:Paladin [Labeo rohita]|uniref:Paladin n=1 Tax=Labeo rohita TaxID=84645 RepID=A0ABQ8M6P1_LABRO|nr:Paladin [Labeo rohita]
MSLIEYILTFLCSCVGEGSPHPLCDPNRMFSRLPSLSEAVYLMSCPLTHRHALIHFSRVRALQGSLISVSSLGCAGALKYSCVARNLSRCVIKSSKYETEIQALTLKSLLYLERYMYLILFNTYLHLEKRDSWQRSFSDWMLQVAAQAGVYELLNQLGFSEFEDLKDSTLCRLRHRWQQQNRHGLPFRGEFI